MPDMSQIVQEVLPTGMEHPSALAAATAGALAAGYLLARHHNASEQDGTTHYNRAGLMQALEDSGANTDAAKRANTRYRVGPLAAAAVGVGIMTTGVLGGFYHESTAPNGDAKVVIIEDVSNSMLRTNDMVGGLSRSDSLYNAMQAAAQSGYAGEAAVIQVADGDNVAIPMSKDWGTQLVILEEPTVDPNGGDIVKAMQDAAAILPYVPSMPDEAPKRTGTIVIGSDATVSNEQSQIAAEIASLQDAGVTVKLIVPGTKEGSYTLAGQETKSGIQPELFETLGAENITITDSPEQVAQSMTELLQTEGTQTNRDPYVLITAAGLAITLAGGGVAGFRAASRRV